MKRAAVAIVVAIAMLLAVVLTNKYLAGSISFSMRQDDPKKIEEYIHYLEALLTSVDQLVSMLVTIQLSLFVLAGLRSTSGCAKPILRRERLSSREASSC
jgi:hypothetical protein